MTDEPGVYWTTIRVKYANGTEFTGDEINVALVSGFTGQSRGGEVSREYLECIPVERFD